MPIFGVVSQEARGHVVTAILIAMVAMLLTAVSYGRMARVYPSAGSAYAYVRGEFGNLAGFLTGWAIVLDYLLNPLICTIWCSKAASNILPIPYTVWVLFFALAFHSAQFARNRSIGGYEPLAHYIACPWLWHTCCSG